MSELSPERLNLMGELLNNKCESMNVRFRALFSLRNVGNKAAIDFISSVLFNDNSALLKHECAYCLGQTQNEYAIDVLAKVLENTSEDPIVRHEAGEALGAIGTDKCLEILEKYVNDENKEVFETIHLAINRIKYYKEKHDNSTNSSKYSSIDPAPPFKNESIQNNVKELRKILMDKDEPLFKRYQAMFSLRNLNTDEATLALADGLDCKDSALFRHEIAFVLGQIQRPVATEKLASVLADKNEMDMVRHECVEALGSIATNETDDIIMNYISDDVQIVRESAIVALDISNYNNNKEQFQFLD